MTIRALLEAKAHELAAGDGVTAGIPHLFGASNHLATELRRELDDLVANWRPGWTPAPVRETDLAQDAEKGDPLVTGEGTGAADGQAAAASAPAIVETAASAPQGAQEAPPAPTPVPASSSDQAPTAPAAAPVAPVGGEASPAAGAQA